MKLGSRNATILTGLVFAAVACSESAPSESGDDSGTGGAVTGGTATGGASGSPTGGSMTGGTAPGGAGPTGGTAGVAGTPAGGVGGSGGVGPGGAAGAPGGAAGSGAGVAGAAGAPGGSGGASAGSGGSAPGGAGGAPGGAGGSSAGKGGMTGMAGLGGLGGTPGRPILTTTQAANYTILAYLAKAGPVTAPVTDNWNPTAGVGDVATFTPNFTVAASGGTHTTVQAAVSAAVTMGGTNRLFIRVMAGTYREVVCVPNTAPPITLYSTSADASQTTIVYNNLAGTTVGSVTNPCSAPSSTTYGTSGSATFAAFGAGFMAKNITFSNDGDEASVSSATQGVALLTRNDKLVFENVRLLGNQDTLLVGTNNVANIMRAYFKGATIEGDVDFICGRGTAVFDGGTIRLVTNRRATGNLLAPSTDSRNPYGFLVIGATLSAASGANGGGMTLGRAWDESQVDVATYTTNVATGIYPNGQAVVRDSTLGAHVNGSAPWAVAATTGRPFSSTPTATLPANRLYEFNDTGP